MSADDGLTFGREPNEATGVYRATMPDDHEAADRLSAGWEPAQAADRLLG